MIRPEVFFALQEIADRGGTPALVFDLAGIRRRMLELAGIGKRHGCSFHMAAKSFPRPEVQALARTHLDGFDVSNAAECRALPRGLAGKRVWITSATTLGPSELRAIARNAGPGARLTLTCESPEQLEALDRSGVEMELAVRVRTSRGSRFGLPMSDRAWLGRLAKSHDPRFAGFHFHHGFQDNTAADYLRFARMARELSARWDLPLRSVSFGGGLATLSMPAIRKLVARLRARLPRQTEICLEPGRALSEDFGFAVSRVAGERGRIRVLDISKLCHLAWSPAHLLAAGAGSRADAPSLRLYGPTCSEHDCLGQGRIGRAALGSAVFFHRVSGYSVAWNTGFNGVRPARIAFVE